mgnify:CR=1 FL=1
MFQFMKIVNFFFILCSEFLIAQRDSTLLNNYKKKIIKLDENIITATRTNRQLSSIPLAANIISNKEIRETNSIRLSNIINEQTGLITISDYGGGEGIQLQGIDSQYVLILIDGVPVIGRSAGTLDLKRISLGNIEQIEVVKGASSSLYGNEALGGVINIITKAPQDGFKSSINYRAESFNGHDFNSNFNYKKNKSGLTFFANTYKSDGYDLINTDSLNTVEPFRNFTLNSKIKHDFSEKKSVLFSLRYFNQKQNNAAPQNLTGESNIEEWNGLIKFDIEFNKELESYFEFYTTQYSSKEYLNYNDGNSFSSSFYKQFFIRPEFRTTYSINNFKLTGGAGINHEKIERTNFYGVPEFSSPYVYLQFDGYIFESANIIIGARYDNHSQYRSQFSPKAAVIFNFNEKISLKGSIGYGFKAPEFRQLYFNFTNSTIGYSVLGYNVTNKLLSQLNADGQIVKILHTESEYEGRLGAETSASTNFGIKYIPSNKLNFNLNIFRNNISNLIETRVIARKTNGQNIFGYYNISNVYTQGLELNIEWNFNDFITFSGGYQLLIAKDKQAKDAFNDNQVYARLNPGESSFLLNKHDYLGLFNRSKNMANFKIFYKNVNIGLDANLRAVYRGKYALIDSNSNKFYDKYDNSISDYSIWDLSINKNLNKKFRMGFGVDNLFDFKNPENTSNIAGRIIYLNININH